MNNKQIADTLVIKSDLANLTLVEQLIDAKSTEYNFDDELYGNVMLSVLEAANNAIVHGNKMNSNKIVTIDFSIDDNFVTFTVSDCGDGFDPSAVPDPTAPENIEKDSGRGIYIITSLADEVIYTNNAATVTLKFKLK